MLARLISYWDRLRYSLWALPLAMAAAGAALAAGALNFDPPWISELAWLYDGGGREAANFAAALVGAMITLTTLAISITMVVLTLAAQQLGPRLIQIFMGDYSTKFSLGLFLSTIVYLLLVLRTLGGGDDAEAPSLAITLGTALVLASVITLLFFVHGLAQSIVADHVVARVGVSLDSAIASTFCQAPEDDAPEAPRGGAPVRLSARGYVQRIDYGALAQAAHKHDARIVLAYHAGAHVIDGEPDAFVHGAASEDLRDALASAVVIASQRTEGQDPEWSVRQLVEVALRALSPGINDDFTALAVIDRLSRSMAALMGAGVCAQVWRDSEDAARVWGPRPTFARMLDAAFDQIREAGAGKQRVLLRLADNFARLSALAAPRHRAALRRHVGLLEAAAGRSIADPAERAEIEAAVKQARATLAPAPTLAPAAS